MQPLTAHGQDQVNDLARRYNVSTDTVLILLQALVNSGGSMAQFYANELGGGGQWMRGGMTMVGDMFNNGLKTKVDNLCNELSNLLANQPFLPDVPMSSQSQSSGSQQQSQGGGFATSVSYDQNGQTNNGPSLFAPPAPGSSGNWWPAGFGAPNAVGSQNNVRYAYFAQAHRLAVEVNGTLGLYDTLDHNIGGFSQQQGTGGSITFSSQYGTVNLSTLPQISVTPIGQSPNINPPAATPQSAPISAPLPTTNQPIPTNATDIFATLERLADLNKKGFVTDAEFQTKKAELLSRL
jgi:hypothetical protein